MISQNRADAEAPGPRRRAMGDNKTVQEEDRQNEEPPTISKQIPRSRRRTEVRRPLTGSWRPGCRLRRTLPRPRNPASSRQASGCRWRPPERRRRRGPGRGVPATICPAMVRRPVTPSSAQLTREHGRRGRSATLPRARHPVHPARRTAVRAQRAGARDPRRRPGRTATCGSRGTQLAARWSRSPPRSEQRASGVIPRARTGARWPPRDRDRCRRAAGGADQSCPAPFDAVQVTLRARVSEPNIAAAG